MHDVSRKARVYGEEAGSADDAPSLGLLIYGFVRRARPRHAKLQGAIFGTLRVVRLEGVVAGKATWRAVCDPRRGGCGREVRGRGPELRRKRCTCRYTRRYIHGDRAMSFKMVLSDLRARGVVVSARTLRWRLEHWPIERALGPGWSAR